ncbi:hypothetical protein, partial [Campylobacter concisus]|uniref:hypothetical protein n=1 Tax=Campylobacter concisus TaxID=199 RepID=UPI001CB82877
MRDYDKRPIIIKDYNSIFMFLLHIPLVAILIVFWIFNGATLLVCAMTSHIFFIYIRPYLFYGRKRSVKLTNDKIEFLQDGHLI